MKFLNMRERHCSSSLAGVATLAGVSVVLFGPLRPTLATFAALLLFGGGCAIVAMMGEAALGRACARLRVPFIAASLFSLAAFATLLVTLDVLAQRWPSAEEGARVIAVVRIDSLVRSNLQGLEFDASGAIEAPAGLARELRMRVHWRDPPQPAPRAGETWRLLLQLGAPRSDTNPGGFDEAREFFRDRLQARAIVLAFAGNGRLAEAESGLLVLRASIAERIRDAVVDRDAAALFAGLAVGATGAVSREQWRVFSATGTTHLVAISGMHVTLFCWIVVALMRRLWGLSSILVARIDRDVFAATLGVTAAFAYALLAGFGVPTQRTIIMLAVWWLLQLSGRVQGPFDVLGIALIVVLVLDPLAPLASGFWLSFIAMATLIVGGESATRGVRAWVIDNLRTQWRIGIALLPLTLAWFDSISLAGLVVNLLAVPVFSFVLVPIALLGSAVGALSVQWAAPLWWIGERCHDFLWPALVAVAQHPFASVELAVTPLQLTILIVLAIAFLLLERAGRRDGGPGMPSRRAVQMGQGALLAGIVLTLLAPAGRHERLARDEVMVTVLDAGDAASFIVRTRTRVLIFDTGELHDARGRGAERLVLPALREFGIARVDLLVLARSHAHRAAGAGRLMAEVEVARVIAGGEWPGAQRPIEDCATTRRWIWDGVQFDLFGVRGGSCVLRVGFAAAPALLVPERLDAAEAATLAASSQSGRLAATLLVVPRRGSAEAFDAGFAAIDRPQWLLVPGRAPTARRLAELAQMWGVEPARVVATAQRGAYTLHLKAGLPPRWIEHAALQGRPIWRYDPRLAPSER